MSYEDDFNRFKQLASAANAQISHTYIEGARTYKASISIASQASEDIANKIYVLFNPELTNGEVGKFMGSIKDYGISSGFSLYAATCFEKIFVIGYPKVFDDRTEREIVNELKQSNKTKDEWILSLSQAELMDKASNRANKIKDMASTLADKLLTLRESN